MDVAVLDNDVAEVHTDPESDPLFFRCPGIALDHLLLHGNRASDRFDDGRELDQNAIAGGLDDATAMLGDFGIDELTADRMQCRESTLFVRAHQPRIAGDISGQDRSEAAGRAHSSGNPALRRPVTTSSTISGAAK